MGGSSDLCALLKPGEPVVLMGPTGTPTETPPGETVVLVGGGLGNAVLFSIGRALRAAGSKVLYFAGYKKRIDRYKDRRDRGRGRRGRLVLRRGARLRAAPPAGPRLRRQHRRRRWWPTRSGELGPQPIPFADTDRIIAIGSDRMMAAVARARHGVLAPYLKPHHVAIGSINSPMQCMMKEICAQCLQPHVDPATGKESYVFSCFNQDQPLDQVDFAGLDQRLGQNGVQEKLTALWIDRCLDRCVSGHRGAAGGVTFLGVPVPSRIRSSVLSRVGILVVPSDRRNGEIGEKAL